MGRERDSLLNLEIPGGIGEAQVGVCAVWESRWDVLISTVSSF